MKKIVLGLIALVTVVVSKAQSGSVLLYGDIDFSFYEMKKATPERVQKGLIMPGIGFQFNDWGTIGITGGYGITSTKMDTASKIRTNVGDWRIGAFFRYTKRFNDMFWFWAQLQGGYRSGNTTYDGNEIKGSKYTGIFVGLTPNIAINVKNGFALNFGFGGIEYVTKKFDVTGANTASNVDITFGRQINFGVSKNFGGGHKAKPAGSDEDSRPARKKAMSDDE